MSERPPPPEPPPDPADAGWVVDVTAPISPGRVQWIAADAAARLKLPAEKLTSLLDNRVGPVTKPLPRASAERVAEVLDRAGAEVRVRPAHDDGAPERARPAATTAPGETAPDATPDARQHAAPDATPDATPAATPSERGWRADSARGREPPTDQDPDATEPAGRSDRSDWTREFDDAGDADSAMLGAWRRGGGDAVHRRPDATPAPSVATDAASVAHDPDPDAPDDFEPDAAGTPAAAAHGAEAAPHAEPIGRGGRRVERRAAGPSRGKLARATEEPPVLMDEDEEGDAFAYGTRDPFAEAERRERANRRWVLLIALLVAVAGFLVVQWAYSRPGVDDRTPPAYERGLDAYRQGAFVSAARAWRPRAEAGDARAMFMLGYMAEFGQGRPWSNAEAAGWYLQAAERDHPPAQLRLASLYARGLGVDHDPDAALAWAARAAHGGDAEAAWRVVRELVARGAHDEAYAWLEHAAPRHPRAAAWLAMLDAPRTLNERSD